MNEKGSVRLVLSPGVSLSFKFIPLSYLDVMPFFLKYIQFNHGIQRKKNSVKY